MNKRFFLLSALCAGIARTVPARADSADEVVWESPWSETPHAGMRLIAGGQAADHLLRAGIELKLADGFKTYWRDPGNSGVPPVFDWAGSENLGHAEVLWPAPRRFFDGTGLSIGYKRSTILPLRITAKERSKPVVLSLKMTYAVCDKLCIPVQGTARLALPASGTGPHEAALNRFEAMVPRRLPLGGKAGDELAIVAAAWLAGDPPKLAIEALVPKAATGLGFFAEGPGGFYFGDPVVTRREALRDRERVIAHLPIEEHPREAGRIKLRLTLVANEKAIECETGLDGVASKR